jgi:hypothetical protein
MRFLLRSFMAFLTLWLWAFSAHAQAPSPIAGVPPALLEDLAIGSRILGEFGVVGAFGHVSARSPTNPSHFLMSRSLAAARRITSVEPVEMMHRAVAMTDGKAVGFRDRRADKIFGIAHRSFQRLAFGESRRDCR